MMITKACSVGSAMPASGRGMFCVAACLLPLMMGCPPKGEAYRELGEGDNVTNTTAGHEHDYGPHGGHIIELGDYHGEVVMDDGRTLTLFLLGGDATTPAPVADAAAKVHAKVGADKKEIPLTAAPQEGETEGKTSRFTAAADAVPVEIVDIEDLQGDVILIIAGKETVGPITHDHAHDDHAHDEHPAAPAEKKAE